MVMLLEKKALFAFMAFFGLCSATPLDSEGDAKTFVLCNCPFDCLTPEGIEHHNIKLTGESDTPIRHSIPLCFPPPFDMRRIGVKRKKRK